MAWKRDGGRGCFWLRQKAKEVSRMTQDPAVILSALPAITAWQSGTRAPADTGSEPDNQLFPNPLPPQAFVRPGLLRLSRSTQ